MPRLWHRRADAWSLTLMTNYSNRGDTEGCITYKANTALKLDSFLKNQRDRKRGPFMSSLSSSLAEAWSQDHFLGFPSRWQKASHSSHRFHLLGFTLAASRNQEPDVGTKSGYFHMGAGAAILTTWLNAYSSTILLLHFFFYMSKISYMTQSLYVSSSYLLASIYSTEKHCFFWELF